MKKFLATLVVLAAVVALAACGGTTNTNDGTILMPDEIDTSKDVTVSFYHAMGAANQEVIQSIIDKFEPEMKKKYGVNVHVEQVPQGDYVTLRKTIAASIASGDQPTIAQTYPDHVSLYLEGNAVRALDDYATSPEYGLEGTEADSYGFIDMFWAEGRTYDKEGTLYSIPFNKSTEVMFYNKTMFDKYGWKVPTTWDEVVTVSEAFKQTVEYQNKTTGSSAVQAAGIGIDSEANLFITLIQQWGGEYTGFNSRGEGQFLFNNDRAKAALGWLVSEFNKGNVVSTTFFGTNYCSDAFKNQQCIMTIGSSAGASYNVVSDGSFVTGVAPYPQMTGAAEADKYVIQQGTNVTLFNCPDKQQELFGWLFIKYLTNYESSLAWTLGTAYFPIRKDVAASDEYQKYVSQMIYDDEGNGRYNYDPVKEVCNVGLAQSKYFYTSVAFPGSSSCRDEAELIIQEILYNQAEYSIEKAIKDALNALENN